MPAQEIIPSDVATNAKLQEIATALLAALSALPQGQASDNFSAELLEAVESFPRAMPGGDFEGVDILGELLDDVGDFGLGVNVRNMPKRDVWGAQIASDAPAPIQWLGGSVGPGPIIDTTGYQSIVISFSGANGVYLFQTSNDPEQFTPALANASGWVVSGAAAPATSLTSSAGTNFVIPVTGRYFRAYCSTAGAAGAITAILRAAPAIPPLVTPTVIVNSAQGTNGTGTAATGNPLSMGGADLAGLARRLLTDTNGYLAAGGPLPPGFQRGIFNALLGLYSQTLTSATAAQSTFNPVVTGGLDQAGAVRSLRTDPNGQLLAKMAPTDAAEQSVAELLLQLNGGMRAAVHVLTQILAVSRGFPDPAPGDEADALIGEYLNPANTWANLTN